MNRWIAKLLICGLLLYNCLFGVNCAVASQISSQGSNFEVEQFDALPFMELASLDSIFTERKDAFRRYNEIVRDIKKSEGLFGLYKNRDEGKIYLEIRPEQLNQNYLATVTLESGVGESGIYSGLPLQDFLFYFQRVHNRLQFVVRNVKFRTEGDAPEVREAELSRRESLERSFSDSVLGAVDIIGIEPRSKDLLVNLGDLLMPDFPDLTSLLKNYLQANYHLEESKSYFADAKTFPLNVEIDSVYGFSANVGADLETLPDSRALTLAVHYSFSQLPENNGYIPRLADDRVGYFITAFQDFSHHNPGEVFTRYINRWHLEPANPELALSTPKNPIVFWIENAVPLEYRTAVKEGVLMWNRAFAKAGFADAIQVQQMPDNADWHPADIRYNTIRWFYSLDAGFARGPTRVNPLTGEILDADIIVDANMVRSIENEYRALVKGNSSAWVDSDTKNAKDTTNCNFVDNDSCYGAELSFQASMGTLALSLLGDTTPSDEKISQYVHEYLRYLIAHEVGHTLGLRHNFHGSTMLAPQELNNLEITHQKGLTGSVMDYLPVNIAPQGVQQGDYFPTVIGPYDEWAISYGYKLNPELLATKNPFAEKEFLAQIALASPEPELSYATDEDIRDINPLANIWDMSGNVLVYSQWQLDNARIMWEKLDKRYPKKGESYSHLRVLFNRIFRYYEGNANLLVQYIGGQSFGRHHVSENTHWVFVPVSKIEQQQALTKLLDYVFAEDAFSFSPQLLNQLAPSRWQHWGNAIPVSRLDYPILARISSLQNSLLRSLFDGERLNRLLDIELKTLPGDALSIPELFDTVQQGIWSEVLAKGTQPISSIRRSLQREHLDILLAMVLRNTDVPEDGRTIAWYQLHQLQKAIAKSVEFPKTMNLYTLAHLQETSDRITKALNAPLRSR